MYCQEVVRHESAVSLGFSAWLSSITERINQTMHYQFSGSPDPLGNHEYLSIIYPTDNN